jgi:hypothetical protein
MLLSALQRESIPCSRFGVPYGAQGHYYHGLNVSFPNPIVLNDWWTSVNQIQQQQGKILLALLDHGSENKCHPDLETSFLQQSAPRYIVVGIGAFPNGTVYGTLAVQALRRQHYKVMLLSLSHVPQTSKMPRKLDLRPNALLTPQNMLAYFNKKLHVHAKSTNAPVLGYVFATQRLDLAIPGAVEYLPSIDSYTRQVQYQPCPTTAMDLQFLAHATLERIYLASLPHRSPFALTCHGQRIEGPVDNDTAPRRTGLNNDPIVWFSGYNVTTSEALCIQVVCAGDIPQQQGDSPPPPPPPDPQVACTTRILVPSKYQAPTATSGRRRLLDQQSDPSQNSLV